MRKYYKAYYLKNLRQFSGWTERAVEGEAEFTDETVCYLGDDFIVVSSPIQEKEPIFDAVTSTWKDFCATTLQFEIPEDLRSTSSAKEEQKQGVTEATAV